MPNEPPTKIYCPPREKHPPIVCDDAAPVRIYHVNGQTTS